MRLTTLLILVPVLLLAFFLATVFSIPAVSHVPLILLLTVPFVLLLTIIEIAADGIKKTGRFSFGDTLTNLSCGIGSQAFNFFVNAMLFWVYVMIFAWLYRPEYAGLNIEGIFAAIFSESAEWTWRQWIMLIPGLILFDFSFYWSHRISHEVNFFWGTHVVHHSSEEYNLSIALRKSWISSVVVFIFYLYIPFLGLHPLIFVGSMALHNLWQFIIHTKAIGKMHPIIEGIMHTPSHHRVHHGRDPRYIDRNYSGVFILWDHLFGTFTPEEEEPTYGITKPLQTNNPGLVNLHYYDELFRNMKMMPTWKLKLRMLFARPGWMPEEFGGFQAAPPVPDDFHKYHPAASRQVNAYVLVQFILGMIGMVIVLVEKITSFPDAYQFLFFLGIFVTSVVPISLLDKKPLPNWLEYARLTYVYVTLASYFWFVMPGFFWPVLVSATVVYAGMLYWFGRVSKSRLDKGDRQEIKQEGGTLNSPEPQHG